MVLKRIGVGSAARIGGAIYAALGLVLGAIFALFALVGAGLASAGAGEGAPPAFFGLIFGIGAVVALPVLYGLLGAVMSAFTAWLYNVVARLAGGLEVELE